MAVSFFTDPTTKLLFISGPCADSNNSYSGRATQADIKNHPLEYQAWLSGAGAQYTFALAGTAPNQFLTITPPGGVAVPASEPRDIVLNWRQYCAAFPQGAGG